MAAIQLNIPAIPPANSIREGLKWSRLLVIDSGERNNNKLLQRNIHKLKCAGM